MGSGAGLLRVGQRGGELLLNLLPSSSGGALDSGIQMTEAIGLKDFMFQVIGAGALSVGYSITAYGTIDPAAYDIGRAVNMPTGTAQPGLGKGSTALPISSWFILPGPSEQSGTGTMSNPLLSGTAPILRVALPLVAVRVVATILTGASAPTQPLSVLCFATA